jgi:hypothetical protein
MQNMRKWRVRLWNANDVLLVSSLVNARTYRGAITAAMKDWGNQVSEYDAAKLSIIAIGVVEDS